MSDSGDRGSIDFERRYMLARYPAGGVVVDLRSGNYFRVNRTAAIVCDALLEGNDAEAQVASALRISQKEASRAIDDVTTELTAPAVRNTPPGAYHFLPAENGYVLRHGDRTVLEVVDSGLTIRLSDGNLLTDSPLLEFYVRALAPKLLFQRHFTVLHASACITESERVIAFAGLSGAGKTTTARAFAASGMRLMSEDLLVFASTGGEPRVLLNAERFIHDWAREVAVRLLESRREVLSSGLLSAVDGPSVPVEAILFLDRSRRTGDQFTTRPLDGPDALIALMMHDFLGARENETWRRYFTSASALIAAIDTHEVSTPDGVDRLRVAVSRYISKRTS